MSAPATVERASWRTTIRIVIVLLLVASSVLLPLGVLLPTIRIEMTDPLSHWIGSGFPEYRAHHNELSIAGVVGELWRTGSRALSAIILAFSIVFPVAKLLVLWAGAFNLWAGARPHHLHRALWLADKLGKWSLLDVLIIAIAVVTLKQFPGGVQVTLGHGMWFFADSIVLAMVAGILLHQWHDRHAEDPVCSAA
jgi:paraquat-inducible protein A